MIYRTMWKTSVVIRSLSLCGVASLPPEINHVDGRDSSRATSAPALGSNRENVPCSFFDSPFESIMQTVFEIWLDFSFRHGLTVACRKLLVNINKYVELSTSLLVLGYKLENCRFSSEYHSNDKFLEARERTRSGKRHCHRFLAYGSIIAIQFSRVRVLTTLQAHGTVTLVL